MMKLQRVVFGTHTVVTNF